MPQSQQTRPLHSLRAQFIVAIGVLLIALAGLSAFAAFLMQTALADVKHATSDFAGDMDTVASLQDAVFRYAAAGAATNSDEAGRADDVERWFTVMFQRFAADEHAESRLLLKAAAAEWEAARQAATGASADSPDALASASTHLATVGAVLNSIRVIESKSIDDHLAEAQHEISVPSTALRVMLVFAIMAAAAGSLSLNRNVLVPLRQLRDGTERFAGGDLDYRMNIQRADEFAEISRVFNAMAARLSNRMQTLASQAVRDPLTRLYSRRELDRRMTEELARVMRYRRSFAVLLLDIDHFKIVNDTHGHLAGDGVLAEVARRIQEQVRIIDTAARFGGEEFAVILSEASAPEAVMVAERIRVAMRQPMSVAGLPTPVSISVSIGIALAPAHGLDANTLFGAADKALYQAKESGRDTVCLFASLASDGAAGGQ